MAPPVVLKPTFANPSEEDRSSIPAPPVVLEPTVADPSEEELNPTPVDTAMNVAPEAGAEVARLEVGTEVAPETGLDAVNSADWQGWPIREKKSKKVAKAKKLSKSNAACWCLGAMLWATRSHKHLFL